jgi:hypothetical protein
MPLSLSCGYKLFDNTRQYFWVAKYYEDWQLVGRASKQGKELGKALGSLKI